MMREFTYLILTNFVQGLLILPWIDSTYFSIFACEKDFWAVPIPASRIDQIWQGEAEQGLPGTHIPNNNVIIWARG